MGAKQAVQSHILISIIMDSLTVLIVVTMYCKHRMFIVTPLVKFSSVRIANHTYTVANS